MCLRMLFITNLFCHRQQTKIMTTNCLELHPINTCDICRLHRMHNERSQQSKSLQQVADEYCQVELLT
jgi:hypothetical protein